MWAAILFFIDASLLSVTFWGACAGHYPKDLLLTTSQRTLMLQSILLLVYFLLGAYMFSEIENWQYLDAVYWAVVTLFTVGFGDFYPATDLGRALLIPFALAGIISLGLVISSVRNLIVENGSRCVTVRIGHKKRDKIIQKTMLRGDNDTLEPIEEKPQVSHARTFGPQKSEFERRKAEFYLMREIQAKSATRRKWVAMSISTFSWLVLWLLGALVFHKAEYAYQGWSYFDAVYFCFEAWTTLGYGDLSPVSNAGRSFYVFWSLLALPTMTVLISNASGTVVRIIRDVIIFVGDVTILPNGRGLIRNAKSLLNKISLNKVFPGQDLDSSMSITEPTNIERRSAGATAESHGARFYRDTRSFGSGTLASAMRCLQNTDVRSISTPELHNFNSSSTSASLQLLLLSEIRTVTSHLKESEPHHYSYDQWVWYLKLIGEDEHNPQTHCRVELEIAQETSHGDGSDGGQKWSWIGNRSPLLSTQQESEWILHRLMDRLQDSLLNVRT
jgi:potassium channel subfamily K